MGSSPFSLDLTRKAPLQVKLCTEERFPLRSLGMFLQEREKRENHFQASGIGVHPYTAYISGVLHLGIIRIKLKALDKPYESLYTQCYRAV